MADFPEAPEAEAAEAPRAEGEAELAALPPPPPLPGAASPTESGETTNTGGSSSSWDHQQPENLCDKVKRLREAATELKAKRDRVNKDIKNAKRQRTRLAKKASLLSATDLEHLWAMKAERGQLPPLPHAAAPAAPAGSSEARPS